MQYAQDNAKYTSPSIQNEIISLCESEKILESIPKYWSLMADETQDISTSEQVSFCVHYVNAGNEICEEFSGFIKISKRDAETIAEAIVSTIQQWGLDMSCLVGQGYDGASVMSSSNNGVQAKVKVLYPNATYVHCRSHVLNLAISSGCTAVASIRNLFDSIHKLTWFLSGSAKYFLRQTLILRIRNY